MATRPTAGTLMLAGVRVVVNQEEIWTSKRAVLWRSHGTRTTQWEREIGFKRAVDQESAVSGQLQPFGRHWRMKVGAG